jgi:hypothetical protein
MLLLGFEDTAQDFYDWLVMERKLVSSLWV